MENQDEFNAAVQAYTLRRLMDMNNKQCKRFLKEMKNMERNPPPEFEPEIVDLKVMINVIGDIADNIFLSE